MMADKSKVAQINGLNQLIRIPKNGDPRKDIIRRISSIEEIGDTTLTIINVNDLIDKIISGQFLFNNKTFIQQVNELELVVLNETYPKCGLQVSVCKKCEYKASEEELNRGLKSGFVECFTKQLYWRNEDFSKPTTMEIWDFRKNQEMLDTNRFFLNQLVEDDFKIEKKEYGMSHGERQWIQVQKTANSDASPYVLKDELKTEIESWEFPYHLIDFETCAVAIPFNKGRHPYEQVAFQFSHHVMNVDGSIVHNCQYISNESGVFPNFEFVRKLKATLDNDKGSIFRFATHENTILNVIAGQLKSSIEPDKDELIGFIESITYLKEKNKIIREGERNMIDLREVIVKYYYNPLTKGSNSIKYVLPAILETSDYLKSKYSKPISEIGLNSLNLEGNHIWLNVVDGNIISPYKTLQPLFKDWSVDELDDRVSEMENIDNGGTALIAYSRLQFEDMSEKERTEITNALLKYCELDTLAMVMLVEHFVNDLI